MLLLKSTNIYTLRDESMPKHPEVFISIPLKNGCHHAHVVILVALEADLVSECPQVHRSTSIWSIVYVKNGQQSEQGLYEMSHERPTAIYNSPVWGDKFICVNWAYENGLYGYKRLRRSHTVQPTYCCFLPYSHLIIWCIPYWTYD